MYPAPKFKPGTLVYSFSSESEADHYNIGIATSDICKSAQEFQYINILYSKGQPYSNNRTGIPRDQIYWGKELVINHPDKEKLIKMIKLGGSDAEFAIAIIQNYENDLNKANKGEISRESTEFNY